MREVIFVKGTPYEMGKQYGEKTKKMIKKRIKQCINDKGVTKYPIKDGRRNHEHLLWLDVDQTGMQLTGRQSDYNYRLSFSLPSCR